MNPTLENAIEIIRQLLPSERVKVRDWIEENQKISERENKKEDLERRNEKFR